MRGLPNAKEMFHLQFIDIWMEDFIYKPNTRTLVRVLFWQLHVNLPHTPSKRGY